MLDLTADTVGGDGAKNENDFSVLAI
jgi:hypothetical protein